MQEKIACLGKQRNWL